MEEDKAKHENPGTQGLGQGPGLSRFLGDSQQQPCEVGAIASIVQYPKLRLRKGKSSVTGYKRILKKSSGWDCGDELEV